MPESGSNTIAEAGYLNNMKMNDHPKCHIAAPTKVLMDESKVVTGRLFNSGSIQLAVVMVK